MQFSSKKVDREKKKDRCDGFDESFYTFAQSGIKSTKAQKYYSVVHHELSVS